jgi:hypothetical protein
MYLVIYDEKTKFENKKLQDALLLSNQIIHFKLAPNLINQYDHDHSL